MRFMPNPRVIVRLLFCFSLALPLVLPAAEPYLGFVYPAAVQPGARVRLLVGGQNLHNVRQAYITGEGVKAVNFEPVPSFPHPDSLQRKHLQNWLQTIRKGVTNEPAIPPKSEVSGWRSNRWWQALNTLDRGKLDLVRRDLYTKKNSLQSTPALSGQFLLTVDVAKDAQPGARFLYLISPNGISAPRPIVIVDTPVVAEPPFAAPVEPKPEIPLVSKFPATLVGQIYPGETDSFALELSAGAQLVCSVCARELQPCIGDAVPGYFNPVVKLVDPSGREIACADDNGFNPDPVLVTTIPEAGRYVLRIRDNLFRGRGDFGYVIRVSAHGEAPAPIAPFRLPLQEQSGIFVASGAVNRVGEKCEFPVKLDEPGDYVFETRARRNGSALDPVMALYRGDAAEGEPLAVWDDVTNSVHVGSVLQAECDPIGRYAVTEAGAYTLTVADRAGATGPFTVVVRRPSPSFDIYSCRSTIQLKGKDAARIPLKVVRRDGFAGPIRLSASAGFEVKPQVIPADTNVFTVGIIYREHKWNVPLPFELTGEADGVAPRRVVPADEYEQAFAWKHLLPAPSFLAIARRQRDDKRVKKSSASDHGKVVK